jgi:hypothetical protein
MEQTSAKRLDPEESNRVRKKSKNTPNTIHRIMLEKGFASEQESKQKRRKPWVRYERDHSLSAVHMDWHISRAVPGKQVCDVLADASRKVLSGDEFDSASSENSILLLKEALETYRSKYNLGIRECISDHGLNFMLKEETNQVERITRLRIF